MTFDFRYPNITGATEKEQLQQMRIYIHQLVDELKWALNSVETSQGVYVVQQPSGGGSAPLSMVNLNDDSTQARFNELKPLIIKSADIVEEYYEEINKRLEGLYVAQSDFGTFMEQTSQEIEATSKDVTQVFNNVQIIATDVGTVKTEVETIDTKVSTIDTELKTVGGKVVEHDTELQGVKTEVQSVTQEVGKVNSEIEGVKTGVETVSGEVENVKSSVGSNLQVIAEDIDKVDTDLQGLKESTDANIQGLNEGLGEVGSGLDKVDSDLQGFKEAANNDLDNLKDEVENLKYVIIDVSAYIKSGLLYYDANEIPIYGLEIGQRNNIDGVEVFNKFARFTSDRLSFYDQNDIEVAYISDKKLYISDVEVLRSFKIGGIKSIVLANGDVVKKWVGGE
jgi:archaellum component FlaC